ncbi:MAG: hypothetical protein H6Q57_2423 [Geobacteraceae bacterium]|nr:hypothetical protein [Geobacteraceae bacterium]
MEDGAAPRALVVINLDRHITAGPFVNVHIVSGFTLSRLL